MGYVKSNLSRPYQFRWSDMTKSWDVFCRLLLSILIFSCAAIVVSRQQSEREWSLERVGKGYCRERFCDLCDNTFPFNAKCKNLADECFSECMNDPICVG